MQAIKTVCTGVACSPRDLQREPRLKAAGGVGPLALPTEKEKAPALRTLYRLALDGQATPGDSDQLAGLKCSP